MSAPSNLDRARLLAAHGRQAEALAVVEQVLAGEPRHLGALLLKAGLRLEAREEEEARRLYETATVAWPRSAEARNGLARCLHLMGEDDAALAEAESARALLADADNFGQAGPVYLTLLWCLRELRRYREALAAAEEGLGRVPDAILAEWATVVEEELAEAEKEEC